MREYYATEKFKIILGWCVRSCGFSLRRLFPNKNCTLAMYNIPFYSFRSSLSTLFGFFRFVLMVRNFQDQNYGVWNWENWTFLTPSSLWVQSRIQSCRGRPKHLCFYGEDSIAERTAQKWFAPFKQGNFDMSNIPWSERSCCASGGIWRGLSIMNC
jgi:hypothetical protein